MLAVRELCDRLGLIVALDEAIGPVKQRRRGFTGGQVLAGMAAAQLAGEDFLVGLDRLRADKAGQQVTLVAGLAASSAGQVARRFTPEHWRGAERGLATATARMLGLLPAERAGSRPSARIGPVGTPPGYPKFCVCNFPEGSREGSGLSPNALYLDVDDGPGHTGTR